MDIYELTGIMVLVFGVLASVGGWVLTKIEMRGDADVVAKKS